MPVELEYVVYDLQIGRGSAKLPLAICVGVPTSRTQFGCGAPSALAQTHSDINKITAKIKSSVPVKMFFIRLFKLIYKFSVNCIDKSV